MFPSMRITGILGFEVNTRVVQARLVFAGIESTDK